MPSVVDVLNSPADDFINDPEVEKIWAIQAVEEMINHFTLISSNDAKNLKLSEKDDLIYTVFKADFPDFKLDKIEESSLKSDDAKSRWRSFCYKFEKEIENYNFATILRLNSSLDYTPENTIMVTRIQFLAIEIARNREGYNDLIKEKFGS